MKFIFKDFQLTKEEFWEFKNFIYYKVNYMQIRFALHLIGIIFGLIGINVYNSFLYFLPVGFVYIFYIIVLTNFFIIIYSCLKMYLYPIIQFKKMNSITNNETLIFSEEGLKIISQNANLKIKGVKSNLISSEIMITWDKVQKVFESKKAYYIAYGKKLFAIIPKRLFGNANDEELFKQLINNCVKAKMH